jgi:serine/threonine protein kinase
VKIATGAARGLAYLHAQGGPKYVHANIKSSNILLNRDLNACISDFGLAQLLTSSSAQAKIVGYRAPEVTELRKATQKSDVYSFGVVGITFWLNLQWKCKLGFAARVCNLWVRVFGC